MKKQEKLHLLQSAMEHTKLCRCMFTYDENVYHYYLNEVNEKFMLGQEEDDFLLDGYCIRKISHLKKVAIRDDLYSTIHQQMGLHQKIQIPPVDLTDWKSVFDSLMALDCFVIIENENSGSFAVGRIEKTFRSKLHFKSFDADGIWDDAGLEIPYSGITTVKWATRYTEAWQKYFRGQ